MARLNAQVRDRRALSTQSIEAMYRLFDEYYEGASRSQFERDLASKTHIIELRDDSHLRGFSTLSVFDVDDAELSQCIFSGDTIVQREFWGEQALALAFCRFSGLVKARRPQRPLYWLLISKGHRTYRYLSLFARSYHPHHAVPTPPDRQLLAHRIASARFGSAYDPSTGIVRFGASATRLRPQWHDLRNSHLQRPELAFFLQRNPGYRDGDELVCICRLEASNLRSQAQRAFREGMVSLHDDFELRPV